MFLGLFISLIVPVLAQTKEDVLIRNVHIVDADNKKILRNQDVVISGQKITLVENTKKDRAAKTVIDGTGKYLAPGLWDMHTHNWWQLHFSDLYIGNGVLGVRNMYTPMSMIKPVKDSIQNNWIIGPHYVAAGRVIEGSEPEFPDWLVVDKIEKIKPALDTLQMEGSDFVKIYNKVPREVYFELVKEAHKRGMRVEGHVPMEVSVLEASAAGQVSFEHLLGIPELCTSDTLFKNKYKNNWFAAVMNSDDYATMHLDESIAAKNLSLLRKNKSWVCPTLAVWHAYFNSDLPFDTDPNIEKMPSDIKGYWMGELNKYRKKDTGYREKAKQKFLNLKNVVTLLYKNQVPMLVGTDVINPFVYPGFSLHKELQLLKDCGIPDAEVFKMATVNAVQFLNLEKEFGAVKPGLNASMILLTANPLEDISNSQKIESVIVKGKLINRSQLDTMIGN